jgi:NADPH-dependent glutamate synthase beta subunit-like oxidoreductase
MDLDTIIVAIGEKPEIDSLPELEKDSSGKLIVKNNTFETNIKGVFAGGDAVNSQNTVIQAIADAKKAAVIIDRYLAGRPIYAIESRRYPTVYVEPVKINEEEMSEVTRVHPVEISAGERYKNFREVECCISKDAAKKEAQRCLRCDTLFTQPKNS